MNFKRSAGIFSAWLVLFILPSMTLAGQSAKVLTHVTTGEQTIEGQDLSGAKKMAVRKALEGAVQNAFASLVSRQVFASNLEFLYDRLLPGTEDFVIIYRVLDGIQRKNNYLVGVESKIDLARVEKYLQNARILKKGGNNPVVLMLVAEQTPDTILPRYWWGKNPQAYTSLAEPVLKAQMGENRILFAHSGTDYPDPSFYSIQFSSIYDTRAAMDLGQAMKADMVVLGKAKAFESFNRMGDEKAFDAMIDLKVYDLASQTLVVQTDAQATATSQTQTQGSTQALTEAAQTAGQELGQKIEAFWSQTLRKENRFDLVVEGNNFLTRFISLKKRFQDIRDIENMQPKEIGTSHAVLEILYKGSPKQFADAVLLKTFEGFGLEIVEVTPDQVKIRFVENQAAVEVQETGPEMILEKTKE
ncbi:MAG: hypothetical protein HUK40_06980 [Desulfobacter sp.]|nr:hypothetical protein [Desulfobacter sp.]WDP84747.1 MAG: hypothetical protein HUN05_05960 [Desulfobacter sp.]